MTPHSPPHSSPRGPRVGYIVAGALTTLLAVCLLIAGGSALYGERMKDADGYLSTGTGTFETTTHALASERLDVGIDGKDWIAGVEDLGDARLRVSSSSPDPVFAGVARTRDVNAYLRGVSHTRVTDIETDPFTASYRSRPGDRAPGAPAAEPIWAASTQGRGPQSLTWKPDVGDWSLVVMNADGSPGVTADLNAGAELPFLDELGWAAGGAGALLLLAGGALLVLGLRPPRRRAPVAAPAGHPVTP